MPPVSSGIRCLCDLNVTENTHLPNSSPRAGKNGFRGINGEKEERIKLESCLFSVPFTL